MTLLSFSLAFGLLAVLHGVFGFWSSSYSLWVAAQNQWEDEDDVGHVSRSSGVLCLEASLARVFQSSIKTDGGAARMVHVASSRMSREDEAKDG
jgi:hypothetical protein